MKKVTIVVTGGDGFVGKNIIKLLSNEFDIYCVSRSIGKKNEKLGGVKYINYCQFYQIQFTDGVVVIHLAGAAHKVFTDENAESANFDLTKKIADKTLSINGYMIFLSSANLYHKRNQLVKPLSAVSDDLNNVMLSKLKAEKYIESLGEKGLQYAIIRSPLIYGPGMKANLLTLMKLTQKGIPLPFGMAVNKRSYLSVFNLSDFFKQLILSNKKINDVMLVSDGQDLSTRELVELMSFAQGKRPFLLPVPIVILLFIGKLFNKQELVDKVVCPFQLDISDTIDKLNWSPPYSVKDGIKHSINV